VIGSSFEVLSGLTLGDELFMKHKKELVDEILKRLKACATHEATLLLRTHRETSKYLTEISDKISLRINQFTDQLLTYFEGIELKKDKNDPLIQTFFDYCLPLLKEQFQTELLEEIPDSHIKAIIACHLAANIVYTKGLSWSPSIVEILPVILKKTST
jgi:glutamate dehydrogenase